MATFAQHALVNDHHNEFAGWDMIRDWARREIVGDRVTLQVDPRHLPRQRRGHYRQHRWQLHKTGLPDPLVLTFYFSLSGERIDQLIIVHNKPPA
jgi:hypothetical protein